MTIVPYSLFIEEEWRLLELRAGAMRSQVSRTAEFQLRRMHRFLETVTLPEIPGTSWRKDARTVGAKEGGAEVTWESSHCLQYGNVNNNKRTVPAKLSLEWGWGWGALGR